MQAKLYTQKLQLETAYATNGNEIYSICLKTGTEKLNQEKLPLLLTNKYQSLDDAKGVLGDVANISRLFIEFQKYLYQEKVA